MASISVSQLRAGMRLAYDLRDTAGRLLLSARRPLTGAVIDALSARSITNLPLRAHDDLPSTARQPDMPRRSWLLADARAAAPASAGPSDDIQSGPIVERENDVTTPEESESEQDTRDTVRMSSGHEARETLRLRSALRRDADGVIGHRSARWARLPLRMNTWNAPRDDTHDMHPAGASGQRGALWGEEPVALLARVLDRLSSAEPAGTGVLLALAAEMTAAAQSSPECLVRSTIEGIGAMDEPTLAAHAFAVASVAAAISARLCWSSGGIRAAALTGMLADCGLGLMPWDVRGPNRPLTDVERNALERHTGYSAALLEMLRPGSIEEAIPEEVQLAAYQHHEREDGSGYPRRVRADRIHDLARVSAVADVMIGLASARADRPARGASGALAEVARQANSGVLAIAPARALAELMVAASTDASDAQTVRVRPRTMGAAA